MKPLTALGNDAPETHEIGPYRIVERLDVALASVAARRGRDDDLARAADDVGLPLPAPARFAAGTVYSAFWVAPQMWFVEADYASHQDIVGMLKPALGDAASLTEQTDAWVRFDISSADLTPLFERLSNVDLTLVPTGFASRTVIDHLGCYLVKRAADQVTVYGPRSSAASLLHMLEVTARSVI
ncbi:MAG: sarcosine oxidase subunit gamma [Paracoccaceae bacterium]